MPDVNQQNEQTLPVDIRTQDAAQMRFDDARLREEAARSLERLRPRLQTQFAAYAADCPQDW